MPEWLEGWLERLRDLRETPMAPIGPLGLGVGLSAMGLMALLHLASAEGWIPVLDSLNLVFHEAGHPVFSPFGEVMHILGGTLMQLLVPLLVAGAAWTRRQPVGIAVALAWASENLWNIARYVGDARAQELPLVGGGEHDWGTLLERWGMLDRDLTLAATIRGLGWLGMAACAAGLVLAWVLQRDRQRA